MSTTQVAEGTEIRFEFGKNWKNFLATVDAERIAASVANLQRLLPSLKDQTFLDVGSGSGLSSLAALKLGARSVQGVDLDQDSVEAGRMLLSHHAPGLNWKIEQGSALEVDPKVMGTYDVVYSWGVLHHTGQMWAAIDRVSQLVKPGGKFAIALYNDQGEKSLYWLKVKTTYNRLPRLLRPLYAFWVQVVKEELRYIGWTWMLVEGAKSFLKLRWRWYLRETWNNKILSYVHSWTRYKSARGMSRWHDVIDWVGGLPFEVAKPVDVERFMAERGFSLERSFLAAPTSGTNNEWVFQRRA